MDVFRGGKAVRNCRSSSAELARLKIPATERASSIREGTGIKSLTTVDNKVSRYRNIIPQIGSDRRAKHNTPPHHIRSTKSQQHTTTNMFVHSVAHNPNHTCTANESTNRLRNTAYRKADVDVATCIRAKTEPYSTRTTQVTRVKPT